MQTIILNCSHCQSKRVTMDVPATRFLEANSAQTHFYHAVVGFCRECNMPSSAIIRFDVFNGLKTGADPRYLNSAHIPNGFEVLNSWPAPNEVDVPLYITPEVERAFLQAETNRSAGNFDAAGAMYRKSLDVATRQKEPGLANKPLGPRLKEMAVRNLLTPAIADWTDHIRMLGNEATHDEFEPTKDDIEDLANLTRMTLIYLFEMPERVAIMRQNQCPPPNP